MLVQFFDSDKVEHWINPIHVKLVKAKKSMMGKDKGVEIYLSHGHAAKTIDVPGTVAEVAQLLNDAMPRIWLPTDDEGEETPPSSD